MMPDGGAFAFVVKHRAAPQGSKDLQHGKNGKAYMVEASKGVKPFRTAVKRAALGHDGRPMMSFTGAVKVSIEFEFTRAKSNVDEYPTTKNAVGDIDKLTRAVLDALTEAQVIEDDRFVVQVDASKWWGDENRTFITVQAATPVHVRPIGPAIVDRVRRDNDLPPLAQSIVDFAQSIGVTVDPWQRYALDEVVADYGRAPCACDKITCVECSARRGLQAVKMSDPVGPPKFLPLHPVGHDPKPLPPVRVLHVPPQFNPECCNPVDHKGCALFGDGSFAGATCPCPNHCPA